MPEQDFVRLPTFQLFMDFDFRSENRTVAALIDELASKLAHDSLDNTHTHSCNGRALVKSDAVIRNHQAGPFVLE